VIGMADKKFQLRVITPNETKVDMPADMVIMRCMTGDMGVLPNMEACSVILDLGVLRIFADGNERHMALLGGVAQVERNVLTILANNAEWPEELDHARAVASRDEFQRRMEHSADDVEIQSNHVQVRRALVRMEVSSYPILSRSGDRK